MMVTQDKYELPIMWSDTAAGLERMLGLSGGAVLRSIWKYEHQKIKGYPRYIRVVIEEDEDGQSLTCEEMAGKDPGDV